MDSPLVGLAAVAWANAWQSAAPEAALRMSVDATRLLSLLRSLPVARTLLTDLQQAESTGRPVDLIVAADRQSVLIVTSSGRYALAGTARDTVLSALLGAPRAAGQPAANGAPKSAADPTGAAPGGQLASKPLATSEGQLASKSSVTPDALRQLPATAAVTAKLASDATDGESTTHVASKPLPAPGVLWQSPTHAVRNEEQGDVIALSWLGRNAFLQVRRDRGGQSRNEEEDAAVHRATLRLQLPQAGDVSADIRVCGSTVAVLIDGAARVPLQTRLAELQQRLAARGLVTAHVGMAPAQVVP